MRSRRSGRRANSRSVPSGGNACDNSAHNRGTYTPPPTTAMTGPFTSAPIKAARQLDDARDFVIAVLVRERQRQHLVGEPLGDGKRAPGEARRVHRLAMRRDWIVQPR